MERIGTEVILGGGDTYRDYMNERRKYKDALVNKWQWLLEGTKKQNLKKIDRSLWPTMAMVFENQVLSTERSLMEATTTGGVSMPTLYSLPIIRNVYPNLIAMKIASVQPMPMSSAGVMQIFYQDFQREDASDASLKVSDSDYALGAENSVPKRVKMVITSETVTAVKNILGASWSQEVQEDAMGSLNIDVESELITQMSLEILREIDQIVIAEMLAGATAGASTWTWTNTSTWSNQEWYKGLGHAFVDMEDDIYGARFRSGQWIIAGRNVVKYIRKMSDFVPAPRNQPFDPFKMGVENIGRLTGYWDIYLTNYLNTNRAIMGVYPRSVIDTGYVFSPYIPLTPMPKIYAEYAAHDDATFPGAYSNTDKWSRNVRTRYARKMVVPELFATLTISA